jgi:hypothetical protein
MGEAHGNADRRFRNQVRLLFRNIPVQTLEAFLKDSDLGPVFMAGGI